MSVTFEQLLDEGMSGLNFKRGAVITGQVIKVGPDFVTVDAGLKSEAHIPRTEFVDVEGELEVKEGEDIQLYVINPENGLGETHLSYKQAKQAAAWIELEKACDTGEKVVGVITDRVKGGFTVEVHAIRAFLPGSLIDVRPIRDPSFLEGKEIEFKVVKMDKKRNNVVVSRRAVIEEESSEDREALLSSLTEGMEVKGVVKNLTDYGAFVDLGGIDGLLHITDISWKRVKHPSEMLEIGQELDVKVLSFDRERNRVSLGLKQMAGDPWADSAGKYNVGDKLVGRVTNLTDYGCFVEIDEGIEGLVHMSEMDWCNKNVHPSKIVHLGQEVEVMILDIDPERRRISLGIKQCKGNPWAEFSKDYKEGDKISGSIKSITDFGIFIGLPGDIDGLVHVNDIAWSGDGEDLIRNYNKGDELDAVILSVDAERERISLSIKHLSEDPCGAYLDKHKKGTWVKGKVDSVDAKRVYIDLGDNLRGVLKLSEFDDAIKEGMEVEANIVGIDRKTHAVALSLHQYQDRHQSGSQMDETASSVTIGDLMKGKMDGEG